MIVFQNSNEFLLDELDKREATISTLLLPECLLESFLIKKKAFRGDMRLYLRGLLRRFRPITYSGLIPEPLSVKTEYQDKRQNLIRINFRPHNADWIELGELARAFGKSRCWLFVYLLKLDLLGLWKLLVQAGFRKVVPTLPSLELQSLWTLQRVCKNFARGFYVRV